MTHSIVLREIARNAWPGGLCPDSDLAVRDSFVDGIELICPCGTSLAIGVHPRQLVGVGLRCFTCNRHCMSPSRAPGEAYSGQPVLLRDGFFRISQTLDGKGVCMVGGEALDGYLLETGSNQDIDWGVRPANILSPALAHALAAELETSLGGAWHRLSESDDRAIRSPTPPRRRHRLVHLVKFARELADSLEAESAVVDGNLLAELQLAATLFRRWSHHPPWPSIGMELTSDTATEHVITQLAVASYLTDAGNPVELLDSGGEGRSPDLLVRPRLGEVLQVEVKTPIPLRGPRRLTLGTNSATELVKKILDRAGSSSRGQLSTSDSGLVAICGYHLRPDELEALRQGAQRILNRQRNRKPHVMGVLVTTIGMSIREEHSGRAVSTSAAMDHRLVLHPGYEGDLNVRQEPWTEFAP